MHGALRTSRVPADRRAFFERVADDVDWTVQGTHPLAGRYTSKKAFVETTFDRLGAVMRDGTRLEVRHLVVEGATVVAELRAGSTATVTWTVMRNEQLPPIPGSREIG